MLKTDRVTCHLLYCMGASTGALNQRVSPDELHTYVVNDDMNTMRMLCSARNAIMLRGKKSTQSTYPLQSNLCSEETFDEVVALLQPQIGYAKSNDFTNQNLYNIFVACNQRLHGIVDALVANFDYLEPHKFVLHKFISSRRRMTFSEFLTELQSIAISKTSMPWGIYTPMWKKLSQDSKQTLSTLFTSDIIFLPKVYYNAGRHYDSSKWSVTDYSGYTEPMQRLLDSIKSSRNVSVVIDGDNTPSMLMAVVMKFMSGLRNVKAIKVVYNDDGLIRWENIHIDKVTYYRSSRYHSTKNNTDLIVGALLMEEQYKGASTTILISSDGDYINIVDMIHQSDVIVLLPNATNQTYMSDLDNRGIQTETLAHLFTDEQIKDTIERDNRLSSMYMLPLAHT